MQKIVYYCFPRAITYCRMTDVNISAYMRVVSAPDSHKNTTYISLLMLWDTFSASKLKGSLSSVTKSHRVLQFIIS